MLRKQLAYDEAQELRNRYTMRANADVIASQEALLKISNEIKNILKKAHIKSTCFTIRIKLQSETILLIVYYSASFYY